MMVWLAWLFPLVAWGGIYDSLTPGQKAVIGRGEQVFIEVPAEGSAWPKVYAYQRIDSTAEEAAAVWADYEYLPKFNRDMKESRITRRLDRASVEVSQYFDPGWASERITALYNVRAIEDGAFRVEWKLVRAEKARRVEGYAQFEPLGTAAFIAYHQFIDPNRFGAGLLKGRAIKAFRNGATWYRAEVVRLRVEDPTLLRAQIEALRVAVAP